MPKRVLVVDDHAPTRSTIRTVLESDKNFQFEVVEAGSGTECLKTFDAAGPFDLVLLDVNMPDLDGYAVCQALRRVDKEVPVVFITGQRELKDYHSGREAGADSYLVKPISAAALRSTVQLFTTLSRKPSAEPAS
ncbi:MAG TPA: response regulator [Vicinamibacteria bacterium]|nr:response regulator [Vicinamibacteria bacterium]